MKTALALVLLTVTTIVAGAAALFADGPPPAAAVPADGPIEFNRDVRPILSDNCFSCHGLDPKQRKAKLRLDTADGAYAEGENGPAVKPGDLKQSLLWDRINTDDPDEVMPPPESHKKLTPAQKQVLRRWIEQGAKYQQHWSFEPVRKVDPPTIPTPDGGSLSPIDVFLFDRLAREGLKPSPEADRPTLIRRAAFALTGLPPTPAEVDQFVNDTAPGAYERMVDRYMASPRYGEEMARHWLDLARYADTHGLHLDNERQTWAYRDWVINAFNRNQPFDQFTVEQIAGDLLPKPTKEQLTATGFNRNNVTTSEGGAIPAEYVYRYAVDRAATTMGAWMGLTGGCAVCHDHKFDPISAKEFYSFYAFFNSAADPGMDGNALLTAPTIKLTNPEQDKQLAALDEKLKAGQKELDEKSAMLVYTDPATAAERPPVEERETVWLDDDFPTGAEVKSGPGQPTRWVTVAPEDGGEVFSGKRAIRRTDKELAQDFYESGAAPITVPPDGRIFAHVFLDPKDPPKAIMLQFHKGGSWDQRATWGDNEVFVWGKPGTSERFNAGPLPEASKWIKLEVPIEKVGLKPGDQLTGFALTQFGGTVYWDKVGIAGRTDPAADPAQSLTAWWKPRVGKNTPDVPPEIGKLLKDGPTKVTKTSDLRKLRDYYLQNVCAATKADLGPVATKVAAVRKEKDELEKKVPATFVFGDLPKPRDSFVMLRGQYDKPGEKVEPATPAFLPPLKKAKADGLANRLDLANWLVSPEHPLTARVTVNRFWQQFFGVGLVKTSGDFGSQGDPPSHPELLDFLSADFRDNNWDVKRLVRQMVTSAAFRQSSAVGPDLLARDPENRLLAHGPRFRLDAEQIRDNALFVAGLINLQMGGPGVKPYQPPNIWEPVGFVGSNTRFYKQDTGAALYRRGIYVFLKRTAHAPFLANFDGPNREQSCTRRERSNTPLQALQLMNDVQFVEASRALADRMIAEGGATPDERIAFAFRTVLSRKAEPEELEIVKDQLTRHLERYKADEAAAAKLIAQGESKPKAGLAPAELAAYTLVANMVLNLDETLNRN